MSSSSGRTPSVSAADLAVAGRLVIEVDDRQIAVFLAEGRVYAVDNRCPHEGNPLVEGEVLGDTLVCAFHGWRFDLETGGCLLGERAVRRYPVERVGDEIRIHVGAP
jgi:nitrite reductase/ring-hydroxylating ferredoxin subunit